jgi:hypothetical protein
MSDATITHKTYQLCRAEIVSALYEVTPEKDRALLAQFCGDYGDRLPNEFVAFASLLYSRGFAHGEHTGREDAYTNAAERLACAGQTAGAALIERIGSVNRK